MTDSGWPWAYLFTAAQTELGKTEEWFWDIEPRVMIAMLNQKKKIEIQGYRLLAHIYHGGEVDIEGDDAPVPGRDVPASEFDLSALKEFV